MNSSDLESQGYYLDADHDANRGKPDKIQKQVDSNDAHRVSMLPCSGSAGQQPDAPKETFTARTEVERLFPDQERAQRVLAARKEAGL